MKRAVKNTKATIKSKDTSGVIDSTEHCNEHLANKPDFELIHSSDGQRTNHNSSTPISRAKFSQGLQIIAMILCILTALGMFSYYSTTNYNQTLPLR
jgi:hypothetical protein